MQLNLTRLFLFLTIMVHPSRRHPVSHRLWVIRNIFIFVTSSADYCLDFFPQVYVQYIEPFPDIQTTLRAWTLMLCSYIENPRVIISLMVRCSRFLTVSFALDRVMTRAASVASRFKPFSRNLRKSSRLPWAEDTRLSNIHMSTFKKEQPQIYDRFDA